MCEGQHTQEPVAARPAQQQQAVTMLEEALPLAIGVGAALLPAMAFGGLAAARAFMYLGAAESGVLQALEDGKSDEEVMKLIEGGAVATPLERRAPLFKAFSGAAAQPAVAAAASMAAVPLSAVDRSMPKAPFYGFAARFMQ